MYVNLKHYFQLVSSVVKEMLFPLKTLTSARISVAREASICGSRLKSRRTKKCPVQVEGFAMPGGLKVTRVSDFSPVCLYLSSIHFMKMTCINKPNLAAMFFTEKDRLLSLLKYWLWAFWALFSLKHLVTMLAVDLVCIFPTAWR
jgi:hypothetical protein